MSDVEPLDSADLALMWRVVARWARDRPRNGSGSRLLDTTLFGFTALEDSVVLQNATKLPAPFDLGPDLGWIVGRPLPKTAAPAVPVATIQALGDENGLASACVRVAVFAEREDGTVGVTGWRFDSAETDADALHPYQHAQAIIGWTISGKCLLHPTNQCATAECVGLDVSGVDAVDDERTAAFGRVNQSHPAFPLTTTTLTGLVLAVMVTLYGAREVRQMIESEARLGRASGLIRDDIGRLLR